LYVSVIKVSNEILLRWLCRFVRQTCAGFHPAIFVQLFFWTNLVTINTVISNNSTIRPFARKP